MRKVLALMMCFGLVGCANPGIVKLSPGTYMLSRVDQGGIFGNSARMKANVISEANEFAESQGKVAIPLTINESPMWPGHFASVEYQFKTVDKNDPEARRASFVPRQDVVINKTDKVSADIHSKDMTEKQPNLYTELTKLDDLRKKGVITDAEFATQKKILLDKQR